LARPSGVALESIGLLSPNPAVLSLVAAIPLSTNHALTAAARFSDRGWLTALFP